MGLEFRDIAFGIDIRVFTLKEPADGSLLRFCTPAREVESVEISN
jgi:hypothetical protein